MNEDMMRFCYEGMITDCDRQKFEDAVAELVVMSKKERKRFMISVKRCLDRFMELGEKMTEQERADCCCDISLYFANEAVEGRLENYMAAVQ
jgi:hypothetical protein